jgi:hypothetical protein
MRTHQKIVQDHGAAKLARDLAAAGIEVHQSTPQRWADRNSIPGEYWQALVDLDVASLDELARGADPRSQEAAA